MINIYTKYKNYKKIFYKYINFNNEYFRNKYPNNKKINQIILLELFDIKASIISSSLFSNAFKIEQNYKIIGYYPNFLTFRRKIKTIFNWYLNIFSGPLTSPAKTTLFVVVNVSHATLE